MAKYRHRIFEMYEFRDEAIRDLAPKPDQPLTECPAPDSWTFAHLTVSNSAGVTHVEFTSAQTFEEDSVSGLREDFAQLADRLGKDSRVLLDFSGVTSLSAASLSVLVLFKQKLQTKGSRLAICCLDPAAREAMLAARFS